MDTSNQILYVGGNFTTVYDTSNTAGLLVNKIAAWNANTSTWSALGTAGTTNNGITSASSSVYALAYDTTNRRLYVGGSFSKVADAVNGTGLNANNIVYWNISTSRWIRFGNGTTTTNQGVNNTVYALALDTSNNKLYVTGAFTTAYNSTGNTSASRIIIWNVLTSTWSVLGSAAQNGLGGTGTAMLYDGSNQRLYVGGDYTNVSDATQLNLSANRVAYWDILGSKWYQLGNSSGNGAANGSVSRMALDTSNNYLYIGGTFTTLNSSTQTSLSANRIARWNILTSTWTQLGGTTSATKAWKGLISEVIIFEGVLKNQDLKDVASYLSKKYGISLQ
jgi:hypothetical protein